LLTVHAKKVGVYKSKSIISALKNFAHFVYTLRTFEEDLDN